MVAKGDNQSVASNTYNPGYSRTSSNNSINTAAGAQNGVLPNLVKTTSRSAYNLNQQATQQNPIQDNGFYQNVATVRNQLPSPTIMSPSTAFNHFDDR